MLAGRAWGILLLVVWLFLMGLAQTGILTVPGILVGIFAIIAAILILVGR